MIPFCILDPLMLLSLTLHFLILHFLILPVLASLFCLICHTAGSTVWLLGTSDLWTTAKFPLPNRSLVSLNMFDLNSLLPFLRVALL